MDLPTISSVLEAAGERARSELTGTYAVRDRIRAALDSYVSGAEAGLAGRLAARLALPLTPDSDLAAAASALLEAVREIPELRAPAVAGLPPSAAPTTSDAVADELWREARGLGEMEELFDDQFRLVAEELAARARLAQERLGDRGRDSPESRVIRKLTYLASQRGVWDIHGLKRHHTGNWSEQAKLAKREQARLALGAPKPARRRPDPADGGSEAPEQPVLLPLLAALGRPVVIVGGEADPQKLARLQRQTTLELEWIGIDDSEPLDRRIRDGRVAAVVVLNALVGHSEIDVVVRRAREAGVPLDFGGKAGLASILAALQRIEGRMGAVAA